MSWVIACWCGQVFEGIPPVACPYCEEIVEDPRDFAPMLGSESPDDLEEAA